MPHSRRLRLVPRSLVPLLAFLVVLGHTCELSALAELVSHAAEDTHHAADHHANENWLSCDAVDVLSSTGYQQLGPSLDDVVEVRPAGGLMCLRLVMSSPADSNRRSSQLPLFLLYASLLI
jgi:hypothetical protein